MLFQFYHSHSFIFKKIFPPYNNLCEKSNHYQTVQKGSVQIASLQLFCKMFADDNVLCTIYSWAVARIYVHFLANGECTHKVLEMLHVMPT